MRRPKQKPHVNPYKDSTPPYLYDVFYTFVSADGKKRTHVSAGFPMETPEPQKALQQWKNSHITPQFVLDNLIDVWVKPRERKWDGYQFSPSWFSGGIVWRDSDL